MRKSEWLKILNIIPVEQLWTVKRCSEWRLNYIYGELQGLDKNFVTQHKASAIETGWRHQENETLQSGQKILYLTRENYWQFPSVVQH